MIEVNKELYNKTHSGKDSDWKNVIKNIEYVVSLKHQQNLDVTISGFFLVSTFVR